MAIAGDGESTLPELIEACKKLITADRRRAMQERGAKLAEAHKRMVDQNHQQAALGWDSSPLTTARSFGRAVGADQERRLVVGRQRCVLRPLAHTPVEL